MAITFLGIVAVFIICNFPRIFLNLHEMLVIKQAIRYRTIHQFLVTACNLYKYFCIHFLYNLSYFVVHLIKHFYSVSSDGPKYDIFP